ncbi:MAG TPA: hypothetical protein VGP77_16460, partial [Vicinamibacterales bacterium]|nr:hypothetical protein [Vicinamibacterales bacterium]
MTTRGVVEAPATGRLVSDDGALALVLRSPIDSLGDRGGTTAEQLLAAGLAAGFEGALRRAALARNIRLVGSIDIIASVQLVLDIHGDGVCLNAE